MSFLLYLLIGVFAGMMSGLLGIGGGVVVVPLLAMAFKNYQMPYANIMHLAAGTSLAVIAVTTARSIISHRAYWDGAWDIFQSLIGGVLVGTVVGAVIAYFLHSRILSILFGILVLLMAAELIFQHKINPERKLPGFWGMKIAGLIVGVMSGLLGIGGGVICIPFLNHCNVPLRMAMVVTLMVGLTAAVIGTVAFVFMGWHVSALPHGATGYIYWPAWFPVALSSVIFAPLGAALSHRLPVDFLKKLFAVFLLVMGIHMI